MDVWWETYLFVSAGAVITFISLFFLGRGVEVRVDIEERILYMKRKWFFITLYKREVILFEPSQFSIEKTILFSSGKTLAYWYKLEVNNKDKKVLVAEAINGEETAQAFMNNIIEKVFPQRF